MGDFLDVFYFVEREVEGGEVCEGIEVTDVGDEVVVEVELSESWGEGIEV